MIKFIMYIFLVELQTESMVCEGGTLKQLLIIFGLLELCNYVYIYIVYIFSDSI